MTIRSAILCVLASIAATAQMLLQRVGEVDIAGYPVLALHLRCTLNGTPMPLDTDHVLVTTTTFGVRPVRVVVLDSQQGLSRVEWMADTRLATEGRVTILAWQDNASATVTATLPNIPVVRWLSWPATPTEELRITNAPAGVTTTAVFSFQLQSGLFDVEANAPVRPIRVDSIVSSSPVFRVEWVGWIGGPQPLPSRVYASLMYTVRIHCTPPDTNFYSGTVTVYYDGGLRFTVPVSCNVFPLPAPQRLRFVFPQGGEVLAPCASVTLRWSGMSEGTGVAVDYSLDSGLTWEEIDRTLDSSLQWTVPSAPVRNVLFRLRQVDVVQQQFTLNDGNPAAVVRLQFSGDGRRLLTAHTANGEVVEWDVRMRQVRWRTMPPDVGAMHPLVLAYLDTARVLSVYTTQQATYAAVLRSNDGTLLWSGQALSQRATAVAFDSSSATVALIAEPLPAIELFTVRGDQLAPVRTVVLPVPASSLTFGGNMAVVALYDSRVLVFRVPEWVLERELVMPFMSRVAVMRILPDSKRLAMGCVASQTGVLQSSNAPVYVLDLASGQVVRSSRRAATTPVALTVSADSRYVVFGCRAQPQTPVWDIARDMVIGQASTHIGLLADASIAPNGQMVASSTQTPPMETTLRTFVFPETAISVPVRIGAFALKTDTIKLGSVYAYIQHDTVIRAQLCNLGSVPLPLEQMWTEGAPTFQLVEQPPLDTLLPGQCTDVRLRFAPPGAGEFRGNLVVAHCDMRWRIPLQGVGLPRTVRATDTIELDTVCVGSSQRVQRVVLVNADPAPLPIQSVTIYDMLRTPFRIIAAPRDTTIEAFGELRLTIEFRPTAPGVATGTLYVTYGNGDNRIALTVRGVGIGRALQPHIAVLPFIPEEPLRMLRLRNRDVGVLTITSARIEPSGGFELRASFPMRIESGDSVAVPIQHVVADSSEAVLVLETAPCGTSIRVPLVRFQGRATLELPTVTADPRDRAAVPISLRFVSNYPYGDMLRCTVRVAVHPRLFLPDTVWTGAGEVRILSSVVEGDRRIATIEIRRELGTNVSDTLVVIGGFAALGEQDTSGIECIDAPYWGSAVTVTTQAGVLVLDGLCGERRILQSSSLRMSLVPQPVRDGIVMLDIESDEALEGMCRFTQMSGNEVLRMPVHVQPGRTMIPVAVSMLEPGVYGVVLETAKGYIRSLCVVVP